jgi:hypothetical protein
MFLKEGVEVPHLLPIVAQNLRGFYKAINLAASLERFLGFVRIRAGRRIRDLGEKHFRFGLVLLET